MNFIKGQSVLVECYNYLLRKCEWIPALFEGYVSATDRDYRVSVTLENGAYIHDAAPECVKAIG